MKVLNAFSLNLGLIAFLVSCSADKKSSPKEVLDIVQRTDSILNLPALYDSVIYYADFDNYIIRYAIDPASKNVLHYTADNTQYFQDVNGKINLMRQSIAIEDSLISEEYFFVNDQPYFYRRIDLYSNQLIRQNPFSGFDGDGFYLRPEDVEDLISINSLTLERIQGLWTQVKEDQGPIGAQLIIPCYATEYEIGLHGIRINDSVFGRTNTIDTAYRAGHDLVLILNHQGYIKLSPYKKGMIYLSYPTTPDEHELLIDSNTLETMELPKEPCDEYSDDSLRADTIAAETVN